MFGFFVWRGEGEREDSLAWTEERSARRMKRPRRMKGLWSFIVDRFFPTVCRFFNDDGDTIVPRSKKCVCRETFFSSCALSCGIAGLGRRQRVSDCLAGCVVVSRWCLCGCCLVLALSGAFCSSPCRLPSRSPNDKKWRRWDKGSSPQAPEQKRLK